MINTWQLGVFYGLIIFQKHEKVQMNPIAAQKLKSANFDPKRSAVMMAINAQ